MDRARRRGSYINLAVGDPDFITAPHIIEAAAAAATAGFTKYPPSAGYPELREAIAKKVTERNGLATNADQVVVTTGGGGGLFTSLLGLLDPGDEVLIPDPGWSGYPAMIHVQDGVIARYPLDLSNGCVPDLHALDTAIGDRTKVLIINSPSNPSGSVYDLRTMRAVMDIATRHDLWVISDECYDEMVFDGSHISAAACGDPSRVITVFSFSKTYAMTGWRIGYVVAEPEMAQVITKLQEPVTASASALSQKGAEAALKGPQDIVRVMRDSYKNRRDRAVAFLTEQEIEFVRPAGAFYLMVGIGRAGSSLDFAVALLEEDGVATVPGSAFGPGGEGFVRVSLSAAENDLVEGLRRLAAAVHRGS